MKICPKCKMNHSKPGTFCSRACANSRGPRPEETKLKQKASALKHYAGLDESEKEKKRNQLFKANPHAADGPYTKIRLRSCSHCGKDFWSNTEKTTRYNTTCSDECFLAVKRKNRAGSKAIYNGEAFDSQWEVTLAKWFEQEKIEYVRPKSHIHWIDSTGKNRKYFPDFYLPQFDLYVDPKNKFCIDEQKEKLDYVSSKVNLIYGEVEYIIAQLQSRVPSYCSV